MKLLYICRLTPAFFYFHQNKAQAIREV